jgi:hypothetical protein
VIMAVGKGGSVSAWGVTGVKGTAASLPPVTLAATVESSSAAESTRSSRSSSMTSNCRLCSSLAIIIEERERPDTERSYIAAFCDPDCAETPSIGAEPPFEAHGASEVDNSATESSALKCIALAQGTEELGE